jgi:hypothetical protein
LKPWKHVKNTVCGSSRSSESDFQPAAMALCWLGINSTGMLAWTKQVATIPKSSLSYDPIKKRRKESKHQPSQKPTPEMLSLPKKEHQVPQ